jgi:hypothetical protein
LPDSAFTFNKIYQSVFSSATLFVVFRSLPVAFPSLRVAFRALSVVFRALPAYNEALLAAF